MEHRSRKVADTQCGIDAARTRLTGGFRKDQEYDDLRRTLDQMIADKPVLETRLHRTRHMLSACKAWLDELPEGTQLKIVNVRPNGHDLGDVRKRIKDAKDELALLHDVPTPAPDIRDRVDDYVQSLVQPEVSGIGAGQKLVVKWPSSPPALRSQPTNLPTSETSFGSTVPLLTTTSRNENIAAFNRAMDSF
jgi:hypothetical protein